MCHRLQAPAARFVLYCSSSGTQSQATVPGTRAGDGGPGLHHSWAGATGGALPSAHIPHWEPAQLLWDPHSPTHTKSCAGGSLMRRMEVVSVSLSLVRGFAL